MQPKDKAPPISTMSTQRGIANPRLENDSELYSVDRSTDTVAGQLENYTDTSSPLMQRYAMQGRKEAVGRGLTNSTIAVQGGMANVLDKSGEFATTDAGFYNDRKTETVRSKTQLDVTDKQAASQRYSTDKQAASQKYMSDSQLKAAGISAQTQRDVARMNNVAQAERVGMETESRERVAEAEQAGLASRLDKELAGKAYLNINDNETRLKIAEAEDAFRQTELTTTTLNSMYSDVSNSIAGIDTKASSRSQQEQLDRIMAGFTSRLTALSKIDSVIAGTIPSPN